MSEGNYPRPLGMIPGLTPPDGFVVEPQGFTKLPTAGELHTRVKNWFANQAGIVSLTFLGCVPNKDYLDIVGTVYDGDSYAVMDESIQVVWVESSRMWVELYSIPPPDYSHLGEPFNSLGLQG